jgi:hypothetical protein
MSDALDPDRLGTRRTPALIELADGSEVFAAHVKPHENGWLYVLLWDGGRRKYSPQHVVGYEYAPTEVCHEGERLDGQSYRRITDAELVERARRLGAGGSGRDSEVIEA